MIPDHPELIKSERASVNFEAFIFFHTSQPWRTSGKLQPKTMQFSGIR